MKAYRESPEPIFEPVILKLETQEEVDAVFVIANHLSVKRAIPAIEGARDALRPYRSDNYRETHSELCRVIR